MEKIKNEKGTVKIKGRTKIETGKNRYRIKVIIKREKQQ